jgi:hypothetical protein
MSYDDALAAVDDTIDAVYGESFDFQPMTAGPNRRASPDPARSQLSGILGVFDDNASRVDQAGLTPRTMNLPRVSFQPYRLPQGVKAPDVLVRALTGKRYEVIASHPDGRGRIVLYLKEAPTPL